MNDLPIITQATSTAPRFDTRSDDELRGLIDKARAILKARADERRKDAVALIRRLAKENGLDVAVGQPARRRGRPAKGGTAN